MSTDPSSPVSKVEPTGTPDQADVPQLGWVGVVILAVVSAWALALIRTVAPDFFPYFAGGLAVYLVGVAIYFLQAGRKSPA